MNADSLAQLKRMFEDIRKETGTELGLTPLGDNCTAFPLVYRGEKATVYMRGTGAEAEEKIPLVRYLVSGAAGNGSKGAGDGLKGILLGEGGEWEAFRYLTKHNFADGKCFALDVVPDRRTDEAFGQIERCIEENRDRVARMDDSRIAIVKFSGGESAEEFAQFVFLSLYEELGVRASVGVGCEVDSFSEIASSYTQAVTAVKLSGIFHSKGEVHSYREYLLATMIGDLPEARAKEYMAQFRISNTAEVFADEELLGTAEQFLENDLNVSETSRALFLHRNTLIYRLDKIKRLTGLDLKSFSDAVTFRVISILYKLLKL